MFNPTRKVELKIENNSSPARLALTWVIWTQLLNEKEGILPESQFLPHTGRGFIRRPIPDWPDSDFLIVYSRLCHFVFGFCVFGSII